MVEPGSESVLDRELYPAHISIPAILELLAGQDELTAQRQLGSRQPVEVGMQGLVLLGERIGSGIVIGAGVVGPCVGDREGTAPLLAPVVLLGQESAPLVGGVGFALGIDISVVKGIDTHIATQGVADIDHKAQVVLAEHPLAG